MTVVLDCNVLVISLTSRSPYHNIYKKLVAGAFNLAVTTEIVLEYHEIIQRKYGIDTANTFVALIGELPNVQFINTYYRWELITADPDDNKYCDCAVAGRSDYIVTEDKHFNTLQNATFPPLNIISVDDFNKLL